MTGDDNKTPSKLSKRTGFQRTMTRLKQKWKKKQTLQLNKVTPAKNHGVDGGFTREDRRLSPKNLTQTMYVRCKMKARK